MLSTNTLNDFDLLMEKLSQKDEEAWAALHFVLERAIKHWLMYKYKAARVIGEEMIDEIFQDTMATLFEVVTKEKKNEVYFQEFKNLKSYAIGIAKYKANETIRKTNRYKTYSTTDSEEAIVFEMNTGDSTNFVDEMANKELVNKLLGTLEPLEKNILVQFSQGEKLKKIAASLDITPENCRIIKFRTLKKLEFELDRLNSSKA